MARLRYNGLAATLGAALTSSGTTITFAAALTHSGGTAVPTISGGDYIPLTILTSAGAVSEIVSLTAYTSGATTGTITRAQESTTGVAHASGDAVVHSATVTDFALVSTPAFIGCKAVRTTTQSLTNNVDVAIQFTGTDEYDTSAMHDPATNSTRITIPTGKGGVWRFTGQIYWAGSSAGNRALTLAKNGTALTLGTVGSRMGPLGTSVFWQNFSATLLLAAGDYIELLANQDSGGALNANSASLSATYLGAP